MCNLYEYEMTAEVMQSIKDHFDLVGTAYLDVLRGRNGPTDVYPNYEVPVIRSMATSAGVMRDIVPMRWGFPDPKDWRRPRPIHARSETVDIKDPFRTPFHAGQRGIVVFETFNEGEEVFKPTGRPEVKQWTVDPTEPAARLRLRVAALPDRGPAGPDALLCHGHRAGQRTHPPFDQVAVGGAHAGNP